MKAVLQRVTRAAVRVDGELVGSIDGPGLLALIGVTHTDTSAEAKSLAIKVANLRIMRDERSVLDAVGGVLVVSQFTLYGDTRKGRRPSWTGAAPGEVAEPLVGEFVHALREQGVEVATGCFGADMAVELVNDGPVTLVLET